YKTLDTGYDIAARDAFQRKLLGSVRDRMQSDRKLTTILARETVTWDEEQYALTALTENAAQVFGLDPKEVKFVDQPMVARHYSDRFEYGPTGRPDWFVKSFLHEFTHELQDYGITGIKEEWQIVWSQLLSQTAGNRKFGKFFRENNYKLDLSGWGITDKNIRSETEIEDIIYHNVPTETEGKHSGSLAPMIINLARKMAAQTAGD
ncbi:MAG: hypothetical protein FWC51_01125, partial [Proteobacteria bacterium]|nr:hypothetical protein [Pseudomonadota bacterium]